jgi:dihydroxyacetone kinase phosphotransfer subunit
VIGIVIVAHSAKLAEGVKEMADQMAKGLVPIAAAGGVDDHTLGTNADRIYEAIQQVYRDEGVLVLFDLGSALFSTQIALERLDPERQARVLLSEAPLVEGAIVAAVEASLGHDLATVNAAAVAAKDMQKIL